jgi:hypothetical protein
LHVLLLLLLLLLLLTSQRCAICLVFFCVQMHCVLGPRSPWPPQAQQQPTSLLALNHSCNAELAFVDELAQRLQMLHASKHQLPQPPQPPQPPQ